MMRDHEIVGSIGRTQECNRCSAPVVWVTTRKGKRMPLDIEPVQNGPFIFDGDPREGNVVWIGERDRYTGDRFTSHYATCPEAINNATAKE